MAYARAQNLDPKNPELKWGLVQVALAEGKTKEAVTILNRLINKYPDDEKLSLWQETLDEIDRVEDPRLVTDQIRQKNSLDLSLTQSAV